MPANAARPDRELPEIRPRPSFSAAMLSHHLKRGRLGMTISELPQRWQNSPARYAAVFSIVAAILLCDVITRLLHAKSIGLSMLCAVIFTAWAAGFGPALLAIALALLSFHYYLIPPANSFVWKTDLLPVEIAEIPRLSLFLITSLIVASVISTQRKAAQELRRSRDELHVAVEEQRRVQAALLRSEMYLNEAQRLSNTGSFWWNVASGELIWSDQTFRILGVDPTTKATFEFVVELTHPEDRAAVQMAIDRASREGADYDLEHRFLLPDGSVKYVHVVARPQRETSGNVEFIGAVTDVTAIKKTERRLRRGEFLFGRSSTLEPHQQLGLGRSPSRVRISVAGNISSLWGRSERGHRVTTPIP